MNKRGISAMVATILVILITVAAVSIIWVAVLPMIRQNIEFSELDGRVEIVTSGGYTVYDADMKLAIVQVKRSKGDANMNNMEVIFGQGGSSYKTIVTAPSANNMKVYAFNFEELPDPEYVSVAPIFTVGNQEKTGSQGSKVNIPYNKIASPPAEESWLEVGGDYGQGYVPPEPCTDGETRACPLTLGVCEGAEQTCSEGVWGTCSSAEYGVNYEATETSCSDGLDNDCDGDVDIADSDCQECQDGATRQCGTTDVGICSYGVETCSGGAWASCDAVLPSTEVYGEASCDDGLDNDCDGLIDSADPDCQLAALFDVGDGSDGELFVSSSMGINSYAAIVGGYYRSANSILDIEVDDASVFEEGDEIMIIQSRGEVESFSMYPGLYEFKTISSIAGNTITVDSVLENSYVSGVDHYKAQVVDVPHYTDVYVLNGKVLSPSSAWDGNKGGIMVFRANGEVSVENGGTISVSNRGYRGGSGVAWKNGGYQGESEIYSKDLAKTRSSNFNIGGGGGYYIGSYGTGGGGGGYVTAGSNGVSYGSAQGGYGGAAFPRLQSLDQKLLFGGAGGSGGKGGYTSSGASSPGGAGGGIMVIFANIIKTSGTGKIHSRGGDPATSAYGGSGGAGGGAGGSLFLTTNVLDVVSGSVVASGGAAGSSSYVGTAGGAGGLGKIRLEYVVSADGCEDGSCASPAATVYQITE
jgi:hypothetical protein